MTDPVRHPTDDRLQEWIDGELPGEAAAGVAEHVAACGRCRREAERIRELLGALHDLPREMTAPEGIREGARGRLSGSGEPAIGPGVVPIDAGEPGASVPRRAGLVAAAVALVVVGAVAGALLAPRGDRAGGSTAARTEAIAPARGGGDAGLSPVAAEYDAAVERLATALEARRDELDPATARIVEENLRVIDGAIRETRAALAADPANPVLRDLVVAGYEQKLDLLRRATRPRETL